jgi:hypothetical protein
MNREELLKVLASPDFKAHYEAMEKKRVLQFEKMDREYRRRVLILALVTTAIFAAALFRGLHWI